MDTGKMLFKCDLCPMEFPSSSKLIVYTSEFRAEKDHLNVHFVIKDSLLPVM